MPPYPREAVAEGSPTATDPIILSLTVRRPIIARPERALPDDHIAFTQSGRAYLVRELPLNYGRWLGFFSDGTVEARSHSPEDTVDELARLAGGAS